MEVRGFEPRASRMQSERSTTELHPHLTMVVVITIDISIKADWYPLQIDLQMELSFNGHQHGICLQTATLLLNWKIGNLDNHMTLIRVLSVRMMIRRI